MRCRREIWAKVDGRLKEGLFGTLMVGVRRARSRSRDFGENGGEGLELS